MKISPFAKRNISRIIPFGVFWLVFSIIYTLMEKGMLGNLQYYPATNNPYSFSQNIVIVPIMALVIGLLVGTIEVLYLNHLFSRMSLFGKILLKTMVYVIIMILFLTVTSVISMSIYLQVGLFHQQVWHNMGVFLSSYAFWSLELYIASIIVLPLFYLEVSDNLGPDVVNNFITGKYHTPQEESRVFMFLDMRSSTAIAEKLGHIKYFEMLRWYYSDLSRPIIQYSGEVYQYVGDEIIVTWRIGEKANANDCIRCFFDMKKSLQLQSKKYQQQFGYVPDFKAGIHMGLVTTGEIGVVKKDIIFTGDVLNTAARIQNLCNGFQEDLLISHDLKGKLNLGSDFQIVPIGAKELRGRDEKVTLYTIRPCE